MSMTREEFNRAFTEVVSMEFADIPTKESEIDFTFSEDFLRKMDTLIALQQDGVWRLLGVVRRHVAVIAIVILGTLVTSCGVAAVIKSQHYDIYLQVKDEFLENGGNLDLNAEFHDITYVPDGFEKSALSSRETSRIVEYQNKSGHEISFLQDKAGDHYSILSEEMVTRETVTVAGNTVEIFQNHRLIGAMWIEDGIYMEILYFGGEDVDELKAIVEGID